MSTVKDQAGWFVYTRTNGQTWYHEYIVDGDHIHKDTRQYYESRELTKFPLTAAEWAMTLEELKLHYPLPDHLKFVA